MKAMQSVTRLQLMVGKYLASDSSPMFSLVASFGTSSLDTCSVSIVFLQLVLILIDYRGIEHHCMGDLDQAKQRTGQPTVWRL